MKFYYDREEIWPDYVPANPNRNYEGVIELPEEMTAHYVAIRDTYHELRDRIQREIEKQRSLDDNE